MGAWTPCCCADAQIWIKKYDSAGTFLWESTTTGRAYEANGYLIAVSEKVRWLNLSTGVETGSVWEPPYTTINRQWLPLSDGRCLMSFAGENQTGLLPKLSVDSTSTVGTLIPIPGLSGFFRLTVGSQFTSNIAYNASAATIEAALEALSNVTAATCTGGPITTDPVVMTLDTYTETGFGVELPSGGSGNYIAADEFIIADPTDQSIIGYSLSMGSTATAVHMHSMGGDQFACTTGEGWKVSVNTVNTGASTISNDWNKASSFLTDGVRIPFWHDSDPSGFHKIIDLFASANTTYVHAVYHPMELNTDPGTTKNADSYNASTGAIVNRVNTEQESRFSSGNNEPAVVVGDTNTAVQSQSSINRWYYNGGADWRHKAAADSRQGNWGGLEVSIKPKDQGFVTGWATLHTYANGNLIFAGEPSITEPVFWSGLTDDFDPFVGDTHTWVTIAAFNAFQITGGSFRIIAQSGTTGAIPYQFTWQDVRDALEALPGFGAGTVNVSGSTVNPTQHPALQHLPQTRANYLYEGLSFYVDDTVSNAIRHSVNWGINTDLLEYCPGNAIFALDEDGDCQWERRFGVGIAGDQRPIFISVGDSENLYATANVALFVDSYNEAPSSCDCVEDCYFDGSSHADLALQLFEYGQADAGALNFCLEFRAWWDSVTGVRTLFSQDYDQTGDWELTIYSDGTTLHCAVRGDGGSYANIDLTATVAVDTNYQIMFAKTDDEWELWVNSTLEDSFTDFDEEREPPLIDTLIGARSNHSTVYNQAPLIEHFLGLICDVKYDGVPVPFTVTS